MTPAEVLTSLRGLGVKLWVEGDRLQYSAPKGAMTEALRADLSLHKSEIRAFLLESLERERGGSRAIRRVARDGDLPLSFAQQRLWFLDQLVPGNPFYNEYIGVRFSVPLNPAVLERSLNEIVRRHEALRTTFQAVDGQPIQCIARSLHVPLTVVDLRGVPAKVRDAEAVRLAAEESERGFDLTTGPLLRVTLLQLADREYAFLLVMHHIISDTWSTGIFFKELTELYQAFLLGRRSPLPELSIQYADFAVWQRDWLKGEVRESQLSYWKAQLTNLPPLQLPTDLPRPAVQTFRGTRHPFQVDPEVSSGLKRVSQCYGVTLFMTLLAAFQALLHRLTNQDDIVVGSFIAGRNRPEIEDLIGFFINTQVLRTDVSGDPTFVELLARVRKVAMGAYANQDLPFEMLVEELHPERDLSRNPLFQAVFQLQNVPTTSGASAGGSGASLEINRTTAIFDLVFHLWEGPQSIGGVVEYSTELFETPTIERMAGHYTRLLEGIIVNPNARVSELPLLGSRERHQLLTARNQTAEEYPRDALIHGLFEEQVERTPDALAAVYGSEQVTYAELNARANRLAHYLRRLEVGPESLVGVFLERSVDMLVALFGVLKAGGAYVPLDPTYPRERLTFMLGHARPRAVLTERRLADRVPAYGGRVVYLDDDPEMAAVADVNPERLVTGETPSAYVIYTSGSSGQPKGIVGLHRGAVNRFHWMWKAYPFQPGEVCCQKTSLNFVDSIWEIFGPLLQGVPLVLLPDAVVKQPEALVEALASHGVTRLVCVPSLLNAMLEVCPDLGARLPRLRYWTSSGEALPQAVLDRFFAGVPTGVLLNVYGSSEVSADATWAELNACRHALWVTIGRPIANTQAYILDERMQPVPLGVPGELHIGGDGLARGYLHSDDLTAQRFIADPFTGNAGRLYKTGDLAKFLPDGNIAYLGRLDNQVKIRGYRIELDELESVLRQHPAVKDAAIGVSRDDGGDTRLTAFVVEDRQGADDAGPAKTDVPGDEPERGWRMVWDDTYKQTPALQDPTFNITGWNSAYTGLPIPADEMREWVDCTVERVLRRKPRRVLEIGCGAGLLLFRIAPHCVVYDATDFSPVALSYLHDVLADAQRARQLEHVRLRQQVADDFSGLAPQTYDAVILNSVVQYFPDIDYLVRVLTGSVSAVAPGGFLFVGDVRSLPLLPALHTSVELHRAHDAMRVDELRRRIEARIKADQELVIDPAFFLALRKHDPRIASIHVHVKRGRHHNELTRFRYDVVLGIGTESEGQATLSHFDWNDGSTLEHARMLLAGNGGDAALISNVRNARLDRETRAVELLSQADSEQTVGELRAILNSQAAASGIDPEEWLALGGELGYDVRLDWSGSRPDGGYSVMLRRRTCDHGNESFEMPVTTGDQGQIVKPWSEYVAGPLTRATGDDLIGNLRTFTVERLPEYMVPANFVLLDALPRTPNGKLDYRALPTPENIARATTREYVAPRTGVEQLLAQIWTDVLNVRKVGIYDNFFMDLGGHSLLATRLMVRIRDAFEVDLPLRVIFEAPTIEGIANSIVDARKDAGRPRSAPIPRLHREQYRMRRPEAV